MSATDLSIELTARHNIYVQRFANGLANEFDSFADRLKKEIAFRLLTEPTETVTGRKLKALLKEIDAIQGAIYNEYLADVEDQLKLFAVDESDFEVSAIEQVADFDTVKPAPDQLWAAVAKNPLIFPDQNVTKLLNPFLEDWTDQEKKRVSGILETGFATGETTDSMARRITGKGNHIDKRTRVNAKNMVRTAVNHTSNQARLKTLEDNDDIIIGYEWVSTLDGRTTAICRSLDDRVFLNRNKGKQYQPKPPQHIGCRSTIVPVLDRRYRIDDSDATRSSVNGPVSADMDYYSFLKTQPKQFQRDVLGETRYQLLNSGKLTSKEFAQLTVDQKFRPLTLKEMRQKKPLLFEELGL